MKNWLVIFYFSFLFMNVGYCQQDRVAINYSQQDVTVLLDNKLLGDNPKSVKINFDMNRGLYFYKKGYYSHRIVIDPDQTFDHLSIQLEKKPEDTKLEYKQLLKPDTLLVSRLVTNFTASDLKEAIGSNFVANNFVIGKEIELFGTANNEIKNTKYKIAAEIVESDQIRSIYKSPRFLKAEIVIRWSLLDVEKNTVVYFKKTLGSYLTSVKKTKGFVVSKLMQRTVIEAIREAQDKLITDDDFLSILKSE